MKIRSVPSILAIDPHKSPTGLTPPMAMLETLLILYFTVWKVVTCFCLEALKWDPSRFT